MFIYIIMIFLTLILCGQVQKNKGRKIFCLISLLPMLIVSGLRYKVGADYQNYFLFFTGRKYSENWSMEWLFTKITDFFMKIIGNEYFLFFLYAVVIVFIIGISIYDYSEDYVQSISVFIMLGYFFSSMNILRQYIAVAICFFAIRYAWNRQWKKYIIFIILASGFHISALISLIVPLLCNRFYKKKHYLLIFLCAFSMWILKDYMVQLLTILVPRYAGYIFNDVEKLSMKELVFYLTTFAMLTILGYIYLRIIRENKKYIFLFNCIFFTFVLYLIGMEISLINRVILYFEIYVVLYIPILFKIMFKGKNRIIGKIILQIFLFLFFYLNIQILGRYGVLPYNTIFTH